MSSDKRKYYAVTFRTIIRANNQEDAIDYVLGENVPNAQTIDSTVNAKRLLASEVRQELGTDSISKYMTASL